MVVKYMVFIELGEFVIQVHHSSLKSAEWIGTCLVIYEMFVSVVSYAAHNRQVYKRPQDNPI